MTVPHRPPVRRHARSKRQLLASALTRTGLGAVLRRLPGWRGVLVLSYHRIGDAERSELHRSLFSATAERFEAQLRALQRSVELVDPHELQPELLRSSGRRVLVTFDDGYRDLYEQAHPVLQSCGISALLFICTGFLDGIASAWWDEIASLLRRSRSPVLAPGPWGSTELPLAGAGLEWTIDIVTRAYWGLAAGEGEGFLRSLAQATGSERRGASAEDWITWEMARELQQAGHVIGAHTVNHPLLARLPIDQQRMEIGSSVQRLAQELGARPRTLAYPVGTRDAFDGHTAAAAKQAGITFAFSNYGGFGRPAPLDRLDVQRIPAETLRTPELFGALLALPQLFASG